MYMCSECGADVWSLTNGRCAKCQPKKLTFRQKEVARLYKQGLDKYEIATRLCRSVHTVEIHLRLARARGAFDDMPNKGDGRTMRHVSDAVEMTPEERERIEKKKQVVWDTLAEHALHEQRQGRTTPLREFIKETS